MGNAAQSIRHKVVEQQPIPNIKEMLYMSLAKARQTDMHRQPLIRVNGHIRPLIEQSLTTTDMRIILNSVMNLNSEWI